MVFRWSFVIVFFVCSTEWVTAGDQIDLRKAHEWSMAGRGLTARQAATLDKSLEKEPESLECRAMLVAYYAGLQYTSPKAAKSLTTHALWILRNHPASPVAALPCVQFHPILNAQAFTKAVQVWDEHIEKNPTEIGILSNASKFFMISDKDRAQEYLMTLRRLDPNNPEWPWRLGHLHKLKSRTLAGVDRAAARESLASFEEAMRKGKGDRQFPSWLQAAARAAVLAGDFGKAERYATEVLSSAVEGEPSWNYGNALHHGNLVLGHVALQRDDVELAGRFLLKAGKTPGSPQLNSFGPNMSLALELAKRNQGDVVIEYLNLCKKFWNDPKLAGWIRAVEAGIVPDFGANLDY